MCGIVGYLGHRQATEVLVEGLSKLSTEDMILQELQLILEMN